MTVVNNCLHSISYGNDAILLSVGTRRFVMVMNTRKGAENMLYWLYSARHGFVNCVEIRGVLILTGDKMVTTNLRAHSPQSDSGSVSAPSKLI